MYVTPSLLSAYTYCKRKLFLERVLGLYEPDKEAVVKGSLRHDTYDSVNKKDREIVSSIIEEKSSFEEIHKLYLGAYSNELRSIINKNKNRLRGVNISLVDAYSQIMPFFRKQSELRAKQIHDFIEKNKVFETELWETLTPKIKSEFSIVSDNLMMKGIIDQIEVYPKEIIPIELKTGSMPKEGVWEGHMIQLGAYIVLMEDHFKTEIKEGFVVYLDHQERRQVVSNPFLKEEVLNLKNKVIELMKSSELPEKTDNQNKCTSCGLREKCFNEGFLCGIMKEKAIRNES